MDASRAHQLARDYAATSLYRHLHAEVLALIAESNLRPATDPYEVMKLRGMVEAYQHMMSIGFLVKVAMRAEIAEGDKLPPAAPPMDVDDFREPLLREMGIGDDVVN